MIIHKIQEVFNWDWELFVVFWDEAQQLLFINSSSNSGYYQKLAEAVAGEVELIRGQVVFRCLSGINRLRLQNVGLIRQHGRLIRYTMQAGSDVEPALTEAHKRNTRKGNIFGAGYESGARTSIGCSYKGRLWSRQVTNVEGLTHWCSLVGQKVLDESIDPDEVLKGTLLQTVVAKRPIKMPIGIDWPEILYTQAETAFEFAIDGQVLEVCDTELRLKKSSLDGELQFELRSETASVDFLLDLFGDEGSEGYRFSVVGKHDVVIQKGANQMEVADFFYDNPPVIWFADGSSLEGNLLVELPAIGEAYPAEKILTWDWTGSNIHRESQGIKKDPTSIQHRVIQELMPGDYDLIFDDDGSGEAADVVAIRDAGDWIEIEFYHCKYSTGDEPGARIDDLYAVCGQAQKSVRWKENLDRLFNHLQRRDPKREGGQEASRFEKGNADLLAELAMKSDSCRVDLSIFVVQPGVSKTKVSLDQLELLGVTENYLMETYQLPFRAIASS